EISRLGKDGRDLRGRDHRQSHPNRRERIVQGADPLDASRNRKQEPAADAGLSRDAGGRLIYETVGKGRTPCGRIPWIQGRTNRLRRVRRRHQLPPRSFARRTRSMLRLRWRKVLRTAISSLRPDAVARGFPVQAPLGRGRCDHTVESLLTSPVRIEVSAQCAAVACSLTTY